MVQTTANVQDRRMNSVIKRYWDGYVRARFIIIVSRVIKVISIILGITSILFALSFPMQKHFTKLDASDYSFLIISGILLILNIILYCIGIFVAALGQMFLASLDSAVNGSPFLTDDARAQIMSLPMN